MSSAEAAQTVLRLEESPDSVTLYVEGPLSGASYHATSKMIAAHKIGARPLLIDLREMTWIDTGGIGVLILAAQLARFSPRVRIRGAAAEIREMLELVSYRSFQLV